MVKENELDLVFREHKIKPKLVVTDSQAFLKVDALVPKEIPMTSFSILQARLKGNFESLIDVSPKQARNRVSSFLLKNIPVTNYGLVIAFSLGIFKRVLSPFKNLKVR